MAAFSVEFTPAAARGLRRINPTIRLQLLKAARILEEAPYPEASARIKILVGISPRHYRLRVGDYRIVYRIENVCVIVVRVAHRREIYR